MSLCSESDVTQTRTTEPVVDMMITTTYTASMHRFLGLLVAVVFSVLPSSIFAGPDDLREIDQSESALHSLPEEIQVHVTHFLDPQDLVLSFGPTSRAAHRILNEPSIQRRINLAFRLRQPFQHKQELGPVDFVHSLAFSPDGKRVATGGSAANMSVWNIENGQNVFSVKSPFRQSGIMSSLTVVAYAPHGQRIVSGARDGKVNVWNAGTGDLLNSLDGGCSYIEAVAFSKDSKRIVSGSDGKIKIWDANTGALIRSIQVESYVRSVAFSPDGNQIASGYLSRPVQIWNAFTGDLVQTLSETAGPVAYSTDGDLLATGTDDGTMRIWNTATWTEFRVLSGHEKTIRSVAFSTDGNQIVSGSNDKTARMWDVKTGKLIQILQGHEREVTSIAFSRDGLSLVTGSYDKKIKVWTR
jgi:WD40 repeat protein